LSSIEYSKAYKHLSGNNINFSVPGSVCFRIPCVATGYDRDSTLPRSLTNQLPPGLHVSCPPVC
jgi:hypothetical protein